MLFKVRKNDRVLATFVNGEKKQNDIYAKLLMPKNYIFANSFKKMYNV